MTWYFTSTCSLSVHWIRMTSIKIKFPVLFSFILLAMNFKKHQFQFKPVRSSKKKFLHSITHATLREIVSYFFNLITFNFNFSFHHRSYWIAVGEMNYLNLLNAATALCWIDLIIILEILLSFRENEPFTSTDETWMRGKFSCDFLLVMNGWMKIVVFRWCWMLHECYKRLSCDITWYPCRFL